MSNAINIDHVLGFLNSIGIETECRSIEEPTFVPGIKIEEGRILVDLERLEYPGDLLHEAGHIAVTAQDERATLSGDMKNDSLAQSLEIAAILWSFAALRHLNLPLEVVFHEGGYQGKSDWFVEQFESGNYIGLPLLQWMGLTFDEQNAAQQQAKPFPFMQNWLRK